MKHSKKMERQVNILWFLFHRQGNAKHESLPLFNSAIVMIPIPSIYIENPEYSSPILFHLNKTGILRHPLRASL